MTDDSILRGFWQDRPVLVTGATGMTGAWLVKELLVYGAQVVALVHNTDPQSEFYSSGDFRQASIVNGPLEDFTTLEQAISRYDIETVFHLGAQTQVPVAQRSPLATFEANIRGTYNLLEACRQHRNLVRRIVIASSDKAYGEAETLPYTEQTPLKGRFPYDVSKSCADLLSSAYFHSYGLPLAVSRCANIYGGGDLNWRRIVPGTIRSLLRGQCPVIRSDGSFTRDYIYVMDVTRAFLELAMALDDERNHGEAFNFSPEAPLTVLQIVERITALMERQHIQPEIENTAQGEIRHQYLAAGKARDRLGWSCQYDLDLGLGETIAWYRRYAGVA